MEESSIRNLLRRHLEETLGVPVDLARARQHATGKKASFDIYRFEDTPFEGALTFCSFGMSEYILRQPDASAVRNEFLFTTYPDFLSEEIYNVLFDAGNIFVEEERAVTLGQLIELDRPLVEGSSMQALFFYSPIYFPEEIYTFDKVSPPVLFAWAIPVTGSEMEFIERYGHARFSAILEDKNPDLLDLFRDPVTGS